MPDQLHPIQLTAIQALQLHIAVKQGMEISDGEGTADGPLLLLGTSHGRYNSIDKTIAVKVKAGTTGEDALPYELIVEIIGFFEVDDSRFPIDQIEHWAKFNAPYVLTPFLREHVFALTLRAGFRPGIVPLIALPPFAPPITIPKTQS